MEFQKRKEKNNSSLIIVIGLLILFIGSSVLIYNYNSNKKLETQENKSIDVFFEEPINEDEEIEVIEDTNKEVKKEEVIIDYMAVLEIPKINLKKGLVDKNSPYNNVNRNIYILKETILPDEQTNSHILLAAHSGNSYISYFRNLPKLDLNDEVYFYYRNVKYTYKIAKKYEIEKTGTMQLNLTNESDITLVTCISGTNKQIVFVGKLVNKENY